MQRLETSITIEASSQRVWDVLVDFARYPEWNPFITRITGEAVPGARLTVRLQPPEARGMTFRPRVLVAAPGRELRWVGHLLVPGLFDGEHTFVLEETTGHSCRFRQAETFRGVLVGFLSKRLPEVADGFEDMNLVLKQRSEQGADEPGETTSGDATHPGP